MCIKVEQQLLRKGFKTLHSNFSVKKDLKREDKQLVEEEHSRKYQGREHHHK